MRWIVALLLLLAGAAPGRAGPNAMVAAADPRAAAAGMAILRQGGSAMDAAIAAQAVLGLVEPQSSGIGGGAFLLHFDAASGTVTSWDGRETAPAAARPDLFLDADGKPLSFAAAKQGGRAVGVPGTVALLAAAHAAHGTLPWAKLFAPAIELADAGFEVSPRLAASIAADLPTLKLQAEARAYFLDATGAPLAAGTRLKNPAYAETLRALAAGGADTFYHGAIAAAVAATVRADGNPGLLTVDDMAAYQAHELPPLCAAWRQYQLCGMGPPSSGGVTVLQSLLMLDMAAKDPSFGTPEYLLQAELLAWADRDRYLADADFVPVPVRGLLDPNYLAARAKLIDPFKPLLDPPAGLPEGAVPGPPAPTQPEHGTSHLVVVDPRGNVVTMTTTVQDAFGARLLVRGFLLNDELTDFSFVPAIGDLPVANRVQPGKRPRSSMAPFIVLDRDGHFVAALGSVGGARIISYVAEAMLALLDAGMSPQDAAALPHIGVLGKRVELEADTSAAKLLPDLRKAGHEVHIAKMDSGTQIILRTPDGLVGGADPRREGVALGAEIPLGR